MTVAVAIIVISQKWIWTSLSIFFFFATSLIFFGVKQ